MRREPDAAQVVRDHLPPAGWTYEESADGVFSFALPGEKKLQTAVRLDVGAHALGVHAFVCRNPDENHERVYRWLLERNLRLYAVAFAVDRLGDIYLDARLPLAAVTPDELDRLLGSVLTHADESFNTILELGFASSIRKEWDWRELRGESTAQPRGVPRLAGVRRRAGPGVPGPGRPRLGGPGGQPGLRARLAARERDAEQRERAPDVRHRRRRLPEEHQAEHDRDRRDEVRRDAEAGGAHVGEREGVRRERDRGREDAEVDDPRDRGRRRRRPSRATSCPANGRHATAPTVQASQVTWTAATRAISGFCRIRLIE